MQRFDFVQRDRFLGEFQLHQPTQGQLAFALVVNDLV